MFGVPTIETNGTNGRVQVPVTPHTRTRVQSMSSISLSSPSPNAKTNQSPNLKKMSSPSVKNSGSSPSLKKTSSRASLSVARTPSKPSPGRAQKSRNGSGQSALAISTSSSALSTVPGLPLFPTQNEIAEDAGSLWDADDMTMELRTDVGEEGDVDEDFAARLAAVRTAHAQTLTHYRRLLERAQASAAAQLHALQAEVRLLRANASGTPIALPAAEDSYCVCGGKRTGYWAAFDDGEGGMGGGEVDLVSALKGFDEKEVRRAVRGLGREDRMRL